MKVKLLVIQLFLTLCFPQDCSLPGSSVHGILQEFCKNTGVGCHFLLQGIFWTQGSNLHMQAESPALQEDSLLLSHWGNPF